MAITMYRARIKSTIRVSAIPIHFNSQIRNYLEILLWFFEVVTKSQRLSDHIKFKSQYFCNFLIFNIK